MTTERVDDAYTDWQVHYETCARCRPDWTCEFGAEIKRREQVAQYLKKKKEKP